MYLRAHNYPLILMENKTDDHIYIAAWDSPLVDTSWYEDRQFLEGPAE